MSVSFLAQCTSSIQTSKDSEIFRDGRNVANGEILDNRAGAWIHGARRLRTGDTHERDVRCRLRDEDGNIIKWYGVVTDITERKTAEEKIREQEAELRQMLDLAPQIIGVLGPRRERLYANRFALAYYGVSLEEWRKRSFETEVHSDDFDRVKALVDRSVAYPAAYELEMRLRKSDGTYRWFLVRYNPLRDDLGQLTRGYLACTDIDDRKSAEERLQQENVALDVVPAGEAVVLDLADLVLADREAVSFLGDCEACGQIVLRNCPAYIRRWMAGGDAH
jgi:PAS domain S-box-containing protein